MSQYIDFHALYTVGKRWFLFVNTTAAPITFFYDVPFGRFATPNSIFALDGIKSWIIMELVSPVSFLTTLLAHPVSPEFPVPFVNGNGFTPQAFLVGVFLLHYLNRAIISPLRTPSRSPSHPIVIAAAASFNSLNGFLMATYLSSATAADFLSDAFQTPRFWIGVALWAIGFIGNIAHDEILLNIRRKAKAKGKASDKKQGEHYAIPTGGLFAYVSFPNYFFEWIEWAGFALAAAPPPDLSTLPSKDALATVFKNGGAGLQSLFRPFADSVSPPWAFLSSEIGAMLPRAVRGHKWYHTRFGRAYPPERKIVIPFIL
ncbi:3-oxo-5-alpha-steroid 4-dehydrogenase-domain-containing protein [Vararia minispora EC-137]|uniref:3-oxo-5-alpha-steroid 4-dehydrogenase-domain-containing protein n=1 Tax=Vararia minispora EC-137 TaxID=1314806 RepID=A0ACB8QPE6_9AGAM|nr:3-oxo-5-alpha-steroid 4-dehydrogenase-domain-containing protein [Vararia minispora EC-137]